MGILAIWTQSQQWSSSANLEVVLIVLLFLFLNFLVPLPIERTLTVHAKKKKNICNHYLCCGVREGVDIGLIILLLPNAFFNFDWLLQNFNVITYPAIILFFRRGNFVWYNLSCTSIYRPLSYPCLTLCVPCMCLHLKWTCNINQKWLIR